MTDEHFQEVSRLKTKIKTFDKETKELASRVKRQEQYIEQINCKANKDIKQCASVEIQTEQSEESQKLEEDGKEPEKIIIQQC